MSTHDDSDSPMLLLAERIVFTTFAALTNEERESLYARLRGEWCDACGCKQPTGRHCQCENDE